MGRGEATPRADEVLQRFFAERRSRVTAVRADRMLRAEEDLRGCLDRLAPHVLDEQESALVALERQFGGGDVVSRVAPADVLLLVLPVFLDDPRWHGRDLEDRKLRIRLAEPLVEQVVRLPGLRDTGPAAWTVLATVQHETWLLRQEREAARHR